MFALLIFGAGHAAINFLLLLAILDDALGMIIIAAFYPDPDAPVDPIWLLLVLGAMLVTFTLRKAMVSRWQFYILLAAPISWIGLFKAHVHPALSLVFVVPFMPATHAIEASGPHDLGRVSHSPTEKDNEEIFRKRSSVSLSLHEAYVVASRSLKNIFGKEEHAPLHVFEHTLKVPVDFGMFFFGLANAGVKLGSVGGITACVGLALVVGKTVGIAGMSALGPCIGAPLPKGLGMADLVATAALGGVGLTVALFVANEAFVQPEMRGQAKMGAVLSTGCGLIAWLIKKLFGGWQVAHLRSAATSAWVSH
ncbi:nhaA [Symbiodinium pilosum]|uniref:NhaA protein n=1 Tax=Symbiodinium pilosum TaxID=2952 RepID=A0A812MXI0_SYMPI|nr:nhaA [Symbiodinium pilosum]